MSNIATKINKKKGFIILGFYLFLICFSLANMEIQIEGANGWASKLPTWRNTNPNLTWIFGGRPITGYHVFLNLVLLTFFHFPLLFSSVSLLNEMTILYCYVIVGVIWDLQWFILNPSFGIANYNASKIWWFKKWAFGFPVDYYFGIVLSFVFFMSPSIFGKHSWRDRLVGWIISTFTLIFLTSILTGTKELF